MNSKKQSLIERAQNGARRLACSRSSQIALGMGIAVVSASARADAIDVSVVTTAIAAVAVAIATVGAAKLGMQVGGRVWAWLSRVVN